MNLQNPESNFLDLDSGELADKNATLHSFSVVEHLIDSHVHSRRSQAWIRKICANTYFNEHMREIIVYCSTRNSPKCTAILLKLHVFCIIQCWSGVELMMERCPGNTCVRMCCFVFVQCLHWRRACRAEWTGRCRFGSCVCWGSAGWPASSPGRRSDSASYSGPPPLVFAPWVGMDNSLLSPLCERRGEIVRWATSLEAGTK